MNDGFGAPLPNNERHGLRGTLRAALNRVNLSEEDALLAPASALAAQHGLKLRSIWGGVLRLEFAALKTPV